MNIPSPCHEMFKCVNRNDDIMLCHSICPEMAAYRKHLDALFAHNTRVSGESTIYNLPLAPPGEEGHVEDPYSSLLALETIYHHKVEAEEALVDEAIDSSFSQPLYNTYFKGETNEFTH